MFYAPDGKVNISMDKVIEHLRNTKGPPQEEEEEEDQKRAAIAEAALTDLRERVKTELDIVLEEGWSVGFYEKKASKNGDKMQQCKMYYNPDGEKFHYVPMVMAHLRRVREDTTKAVRAQCRLNTSG